MKRDIFETSKVKSIQQGSIFYGAVADGISKPVHGVIITPRCDIEQKKVLNIHYLPITTLKDWINNDLIASYRAEVAPAKRKELESKLSKQGVSIHMDAEYKLSKDALKAILPKDKDTKLLEEILSYWNLFDDAICQDSIKLWNNYNNRLADLTKGKMERYLLLEHWDDSKDAYYVINLTQVKHVSLEVSERLVVGVDSRLVNPETEDLFYFKSPTATRFQVVAQLKSPYIEYVCQKFSNAFFRIGIEDWPHKKMADVIKGTI